MAHRRQRSVAHGGDVVKRAFLVIIDWDEPESGPSIGDVMWALKYRSMEPAWDIHTTEATAEMLAHHGVPFPQAVTS